MEGGLRSGRDLRDGGGGRDDVGDRVDVAVRKEDDGAIVVVGNGTAVKPGVQGRVGLGDGEKEPEGEGKNGGDSV